MPLTKRVAFHGTVLDKNSAFQQWNIDQEEVDGVVRIVSQTLSEAERIDISRARISNALH